jgi:hypothetical protein
MEGYTDVRVSPWERAPGHLRRLIRSGLLRAARNTRGKRDVVDRGNVPPSEENMGLAFPNMAGLFVSEQSGGCPP